MLATQPDLDDNASSSRLPCGLKAKLTAPVDIASLAYFRVVFGAILLWEVYRYFANGWIERYYIEPLFYFKYYGFDWVHPWPGFGMYLHFAALGLLAACILLGLFYRASSALFFLGFTYVFLLDQANYLNHFYLVSLISFLLIFLPANRAFSLDALRRPTLRSDAAPAWTLWLLRFQIGLTYVYGGIAKLNYDWLHGEPMRAWLSERSDFPLIGSLFSREPVVYAFSYGGLAFDLLIVPLLLWRRTRWFGVAWMCAFHLLNAQLFSIGIFPWLMLFATPIFFPPQWLRRTLSWRRYHTAARVVSNSTSASAVRLSRPAAWTLGAFVVLQIVFPFRHLLYPGNPSWTEQGHRFAWHMKLRDKEATAHFIVSDHRSEQTWSVDASDFLTRRQLRKMPARPDMVLQFSHFLADWWRLGGYEDVEVRVVSEASLNGRKPQPLVDPLVDLSRQHRSLLPKPWIVPLDEPLMPSSDRRRAAK